MERLILFIAALPFLGKLIAGWRRLNKNRQRIREERREQKNRN